MFVTMGGTTPASYVRHSTILHDASHVCTNGVLHLDTRVLAPQVIPTAELLTSARKAVNAWAPLANHPSLAGLRGTFVSDEIEGTNALFFVHDYHPGESGMVWLRRKQIKQTIMQSNNIGSFNA